MSWYHIPGNEQDVAVSTRVRLARNLKGYPFPHRLDAARAKELIGKVGAILEKNGFIRTDFADISRAAAGSLVEKRFISPRFARESLPHALFLNDPCNLSVMVCEEDHIRIQCILPGLSPKDAYEGAHKVEALLDSSLDLAFDGQWGYLTACPTNIGTAMRASVMLSLPLLSAAGRMEALAHRLGQTGLCLRGSFGEGTSAAGDLYQVSNRVTLGVSEQEVLTLLEDSVRGIIKTERGIRERIAGEELDKLSDRILRAEGVLRHARMVSAGELLELLGLLRMGAAMGITPDVRVESLTALLVEAMPATLTLGVEPPPKNETERDILRANAVRERVFGA
jgi:protein arginine kinase